MITVKDEILSGEPLYRLIDNNGNLVYDNLKIELKTPVKQAGTPLNKVLFDSINEDFQSLYRNIPKGLICMWSGSTVPDGWLLCNGENGTPDLRDRFIVGSGATYTIGNTGGSNTVALTTDDLPSHIHDIKVRASASERTQSGTGNVLSVDWYGADTTELVRSTHGDSNYDFKINTSSTGEGLPHENRPPYYALAFIMKA